MASPTLRTSLAAFPIISVTVVAVLSVGAVLIAPAVVGDHRPKVTTGALAAATLLLGVSLFLAYKDQFEAAIRARWPIEIGTLALTVAFIVTGIWRGDAVPSIGNGLVAVSVMACAGALIADHWRSGVARGTTRSLATSALVIAIALAVLVLYEVPNYGRGELAVRLAAARVRGRNA